MSNNKILLILTVLNDTLNKKLAVNEKLGFDIAKFLLPNTKKIRKG